MQEEEININGGVVQNDKMDENIKHAVPLSGIKPGASNEELLDAILQAPQDSLLTWEECLLPSGGLYYGWPDGLCQVKPMGQVAEKILATQRLAASGQSIDYLFRECCRFPSGFDPTDLLLGDRIFLLYYLRGITHGNLYEFAVTCPNQECQSVNTHSYDLNDLATTIKPGNPSLGSEPFRIILPYLSEITGRDFWVSIRFLRAYDANNILASKKTRKKMLHQSGVKSKAAEIAKMRAEESKRDSVNIADQQRQNVTLDTALDDNLEKVIVDILGVQDRFKIRSFVQKMHARDTATIREWLRENTPGIDSTIDIVCPDCGHEFTVELPITENFFRPSKR